DLSGGDVGAALGAVTDGPLAPRANDTPAESPTKSTGTTPGNETDTTPGSTTPGSLTESATVSAYSGAVISIDGIVYSVTKNGTFPKTNPFLRLVSVTATSVELSLIAGELTTSGAQAFYLDKGRAVGLLNASEQVTYKVRFVRPVENSSGITGGGGADTSSLGVTSPTANSGSTELSAIN
ncbi:MAG: hypothetical protein JWO69_13, partial [Thermoleophilia bacterium]|nr:hypothetical protein [Thermoleophilia bacterium]